MYKRMSKNMAACVALVLSIALVAGCSSNSGEANNPEESSNEVVIKTARLVTPDIKFKNGESIDDNVHYKWAKEKLGITIKTDWSVGTGDAFNTKIRLLMNSGGDLPDVFTISNPTLESQLIDSGKVMDITEAFDKYASPRLKELYAKYPQIWYPVTQDGHKFGLPAFNAGSSFSVLWIRQDWLDKLQLKVPKTIEEMEHVMDAFVNQDPDGNGQKDTLGLSLSLKKGIGTMTNTFMASGDFVFGSTALPTYWQKGTDGELQYGSIQPSVKAGISKLGEWMKKGYLDADAGTMDEAKAAESFVQGKSGMIFGPTWMGQYPFSGDMKFDYQPVPVPAGIDGQQGYGAEPLSGIRFYFNNDFKHMDAFFKYLDAIMGPGFYDPESDFAYGWAEGYDYVMVDGQPVYDSAQIPGGAVEVKKYTLFGNDIQTPLKELEVMASLGEGKSPETPYEMYFANRPKKWAEAATVLKTFITQASILNEFTGAPTPTMVQKGELLRKMEDEAFLKIIYNQSSPDLFDTFVENWKNAGGDDLTKEVNDWYKSVAQ